MSGTPTPALLHDAAAPEPERRHHDHDRRGASDRRASARADLSLADAAELAALTPAFDLLGYGEAASRHCLAMTDAEGRLLLVAAPDAAARLLPWADARLNRPFLLRLAPAEAIAELLARLGEHEHAMAGLAGAEVAGGPAGVQVESLRLETLHSEESPIIRLTNSTLYDAYRAGVSDIHLESTAAGLRVRYRLDGVLTTVAEPRGTRTAEQVISRIKVMAELDIAERRIPQDGRFKVSINGREVDFRVSIMPSMHGEDAVLRILARQGEGADLAGPSRITLEGLGFSGQIMRTLRRLAREPYGMLLVTGPTGSGKTTTLYALVSEVNSGGAKLITIEDPVEYQFADVLQIPVNEKKGLTFARGLRSILRHDPDTIMVGEIRDAETAQIAVQSALTGHLVFSTVHANNALDVLSRFLHMGVDPRSFASAINGILAQRLVRLNCPHCLGPVEPDAQVLADSGLLDDPAVAVPRPVRLLAGRGCEACRGTGYKGRKTIAEVLPLNEALREMIVAGASTQALREAAEQAGMRSLRAAALDLVRAGETTLEEINRVTFVA